MKIDTTKVLKNLKGEEMKMLSSEMVDGKEVTKESPMVLREIITNVLNMESNEHRLTAEHKNKAFQIMKRLWDDKDADLTVDQRALIKERALLFFPTMTAGLIVEELEEKEVSSNDKGEEVKV